MTADDMVEIPSDWVPWYELSYWVVWIVRRYYRPELDEMTAKRWMPDVVLALRHDVDNRKEPRLGLWDHGRFVEEIDWLDNYVVENWSTGLVRRCVPQVGESPAFTLATHFAWLMSSVRQVAQRAGLLPAAEQQAQLGVGEGPATAPEPVPERAPPAPRTATRPGLAEARERGVPHARAWMLRSAWEHHKRPPRWGCKRTWAAARDLYPDAPELHEKLKLRTREVAWTAATRLEWRK